VTTPVATTSVPVVTQPPVKTVTPTTTTPAQTPVPAPTTSTPTTLEWGAFSGYSSADLSTLESLVGKQCFPIGWC
jgi:hypothetical protein